MECSDSSRAAPATTSCSSPSAPPSTCRTSAGRACGTSTRATTAPAPLEMLDSGDWVVPHFNGLLRVDKPALLYWLQTGGLRGVRRQRIQRPPAVGAGGAGRGPADLRAGPAPVRPGDGTARRAGPGQRDDVLRRRPLRQPRRPARRLHGADVPVLLAGVRGGSRWLAGGRRRRRGAGRAGQGAGRGRGALRRGGACSSSGRGGWACSGTGTSCGGPWRAAWCSRRGTPWSASKPRRSS